MRCRHGSMGFASPRRQGRCATSSTNFCHGTMASPMTACSYAAIVVGRCHFSTWRAYGIGWTSGGRPSRRYGGRGTEDPFESPTGYLARSSMGGARARMVFVYGRRSTMGGCMSSEGPAWRSSMGGVRLWEAFVCGRLAHTHVHAHTHGMHMHMHIRLHIHRYLHMHTYAVYEDEMISIIAAVLHNV